VRVCVRAYLLGGDDRKRERERVSVCERERERGIEREGAPAGW
jgi:hypothetical protein